MSGGGAEFRKTLVVSMVVLAAAGVVFAGLAWLTGEDRWMGPAVVAIVALAGPAVSLVFRSHPGSAAIWIAIVLAGGQGILGVEETEILTGVSLVAIGALLGSFIPRRWQYPSAAAWALVLALAPIWWSGSADLPLGLGLSAAFLVMFWLNLEIQYTQRSIRVERARSHEVINRAAAPILEMDFSGAIDDIRDLGASEGGARQALREDPDRVSSIFGKVVATAMNDAAITELRAADVDVPIAVAGESVLPENLAPTADWLAALAEGALSWEGTLLVRVADGSRRWFAFRHIVPGDDRGLERTYLTLIDISEAKALQADLDKAQSEFIATISHELRTPLAAVVGFSAELADHPDEYDEETMVEMLRLIHRQSREISYIVDDLMVASRADLGSMKVVPEPFEVRSVVNEVVEATGTEAAIVEHANPTAYADPIRFAQIMRNLLTNVGRYGGEHARIEIDGDGDLVIVEVIDDGPGIPEDRVDQIFRNNGSVASSEVIGSMGLGLHVSRSLARMMGSSLSYERRDGESRFRIDLPAVGDS